MSEFLKRQLMSLQNQAGADGGEGGSGGQGSTTINFEDPAIKAQLDQYVEQHVSGLKAKTMSFLVRINPYLMSWPILKANLKVWTLMQLKGCFKKLDKTKKRNCLLRARLTKYSENVPSV